MTDRIRTRGWLEALLADSASRQISPQDVRDFSATTHYLILKWIGSFWATIKATATT